MSFPLVFFLRKAGEPWLQGWGLLLLAGLPFYGIQQSGTLHVDARKWRCAFSPAVANKIDF